MTHSPGLRGRTSPPFRGNTFEGGPHSVVVPLKDPPVTPLPERVEDLRIDRELEEVDRTIHEHGIDPARVRRAEPLLPGGVTSPVIWRRGHIRPSDRVLIEAGRIALVVVFGMLSQLTEVQPLVRNEQ